VHSPFGNLNTLPKCCIFPNVTGLIKLEKSIFPMRVEIEVTKITEWGMSERTKSGMWIKVCWKMLAASMKNPNECGFSSRVDLVKRLKAGQRFLLLILGAFRNIFRVIFKSFKWEANPPFTRVFFYPTQWDYFWPKGKKVDKIRILGDIFQIER